MPSSGRVSVSRGGRRWGVACLALQVTAVGHLSEQQGSTPEKHGLTRPATNPVIHRRFSPCSSLRPSLASRSPTQPQTASRQTTSTRFPNTSDSAGCNESLLSTPRFPEEDTPPATRHLLSTLFLVFQLHFVSRASGRRYGSRQGPRAGQGQG